MVSAVRRSIRLCQDRAKGLIGMATYSYIVKTRNSGKNNYRTFPNKFRNRWIKYGQSLKNIIGQVGREKVCKEH